MVFSEAFKKALTRERVRLDKEVERRERASSKAFEEHQQALAGLEAISEDNVEGKAADWREVYP